MAVELGMNRHVAKPPDGETEDQFRERRNRERTYLVLWVHDRSLATQTGRHWMLPEDDLVKNSHLWHENKFIRPEDVIVAAFVQLRRIAVRVHPNSPHSFLRPFRRCDPEIVYAGRVERSTNISTPL